MAKKKKFGIIDSDFPTKLARESGIEKHIRKGYGTKMIFNSRDEADNYRVWNVPRGKVITLFEKDLERIKEFKKERGVK